MVKMSQDRFAVYFSAGIIACAFTLGTWFFKNSVNVNDYIKSYAHPENCLLIDAHNWNGFNYIKFVDSTCRGSFDKIIYLNNQEWHSVDSNSKYFPIFRQSYNDAVAETLGREGKND